MTVDSVITSVFGTEDFAQYEQNVYEKYQEIAEREIIAKLNERNRSPPSEFSQRNSSSESIALTHVSWLN